jgi:hypothetical protein
MVNWFAEPTHCPALPAPQACAVRYCVWQCLAHAAFSNGNANRENNPARVDKHSDLFGVFEGEKKIAKFGETISCFLLLTR